MGNLLQSCAEVREQIELSFGVVSGIGPGNGVLDGGPHAARGRCSFSGVLLQTYETQRKMQKLGWFWEVRVTQDHRQHNHSIECVLFPIRL